jgi:hypothetical protein
MEKFKYKSWIYYIPFFGIILFLIETETWNYNKMGYKFHPVDQVTKSVWTHLGWIFIHSVSIGALITYGILMPSIKLIAS